MAVTKILLVGGGKAAAELLDFLSQDSSIQIKAVVDLNAEAEGMVKARSLGISTGSAMEVMVQRRDVDVIFELTGNSNVRKTLIGLMRGDQEIISAGAARLMSGLMQRQAEAQNHRIAGDITRLRERMATAITQVDRIARQAGQILKDNQMLAINAQIEAAHMGEAGASFAVIGERLQRLFNDLSSSLGHIKAASDENHALLGDLKSTELRLTEMESLIEKEEVCV